MAGQMWTDEHVAAALDMDTAIASQRFAFEALARGQATLAPKTSLPAADGGTTLSYLSALSPQHGVVHKLLSVRPDNPQRGLPVITATVFVLDPDTGELIATLAGTTLTTLRTAAASAVAADVLARSDAGVLAVFGTGVQARAHVHALSRVRVLREVRVCSRDLTRGRAVAAELSEQLGLSVHAARDSREALRDADLVATCTFSAEPVLAAADLAPGTTVLSVGGFQAHRREIGPDVLRGADAVVVDEVDTALTQAGTIIEGVKLGILDRSALITLGDVLLGAPARTSDADFVFHNSVGLGVQDAALAHAVLGTLEPGQRVLP